jgi:hypothetical protein
MRVKKEKQTNDKSTENEVQTFEQHFTADDVVVMLKVVDIALSNHNIFTIISEKLDLADEHLYDLHEELKNYLSH